MKIVGATKNDARALTELTIRSKAYWNYGAEQIKAWMDELTITEKYIEDNEVYKGIENGLLIGFYAFAPDSRSNLKLNYLFVDPKFIGRGYGKILLIDFLKRIEISGFDRVILDADPHAEEFYAKHGFQVVGQLESSIKNRFLPIMARDIRTVHKYGGVHNTSSQDLKLKKNN